MKRCPQCNFIYDDSDESCDFDGAPLNVVADDEVDSLQSTSVPTKQRSLLKWLIGSAALAALLLVCLLLTFVGYRLSRRPGNAWSGQIEPVPLPTATSAMNPRSQVVQGSTLATAERPIPATEAKPPAQSNGAVMSRKPVSTSTSGDIRSGQSVIRLTNGATIVADEVWRTREGIWYRRSGMVTLIKTNQVKSIEKANKG